MMLLCILLRAQVALAEDPLLERGEVVYEENAVQVVDLVLEGDGQKVVAAVGELLAVQVERLDHHAGVPADVGGELGDGEAPLLLEGLTFSVDDLRIDGD